MFKINMKFNPKQKTITLGLARFHKTPTIESLICPIDRKDVAMFLHCTEGSTAVTIDYFLKYYECVFIAHNIKIEFEPSLKSFLIIEGLLDAK